MVKEEMQCQEVQAMGNKLPMMEVVKGDGNNFEILEVVNAKILQVMSDGGKQTDGWFLCDSVPIFFNLLLDSILASLDSLLDTTQRCFF